MKKNMITFAVIAVFAAGFTIAALVAKGGGTGGAAAGAAAPSGEAASAAATVFTLSVPIYGKPLAEAATPPEAAVTPETATPPLAVMPPEDAAASEGVPEAVAPSGAATPLPAVSPSPSGSDPLSVLTEDENFVIHGMTLKELSEPVKLDRQAALDRAAAYGCSWDCKEAESVTAVLALFTDQMPNPLPGSGIVLKDYPAWIVTYHGVTLEFTGGKGFPTCYVNGDGSVVVDANSGEWLVAFSYSVK